MRSKQFGFLRLGLVFAIALAGACGDDDNTNPPDAANPPDASHPDARLPPDARQGDGNDTFDTAEAVDLGTETDGVISPPGDDDFYRFDVSGAAGQWLVIYTTSATQGQGQPDTVITLYDSTRTQVAQDDDSLPWVGTDSELFFKLPADGTYYVQVREYSDWAGTTLEGGPDYTYTIGLGLVDLTRVTADDETAPSVAVTTTAGTGYEAAVILGTFDNATDEDIFTFTVPPPGEGTWAGFDVAAYPGGTGGSDSTGCGSMSDPGELTVTSADGAIVYAKGDYSAGGLFEVYPPLVAGNYAIHIKHPTTAAGTNDFYVMKFYTWLGVAGTAPENPPEAEVPGSSSNDTFATAETITMSDDGSKRDGYILAFIDPATDVDYFAFNMIAGDKLGIGCGSMSSGGGMTVHAEVHDASDAVVSGATANETLANGLQMTGVTLPSAGTYYLKLTGTPVSGVNGVWVRCGVHGAP